jgi:hypothetical protein
MGQHKRVPKGPQRVIIEGFPGNSPQREHGKDVTLFSKGPISRWLKSAGNRVPFYQPL